MAALSPETGPLSSAGDMAPWLSLVGIGEDGREGLSKAALAALDGAAHVFGGARHLELAAPFSGRPHAWPSPLHEAFPVIAALKGEPVCVLASGDPFHYGIGVQLKDIVPIGEMRVYPQPSSFALACARLGLAQQDCALVSLHGRELGSLVRYLQPRHTVLALSWDGSTPAAIATLLTRLGFGASHLTVLEAMGGRRERIRSARADAFDLADIDPLNLVAVAVADAPEARVLPLAAGLDDALFASDGQMTKADIRALTLAALAPRAGELLWDVGAGSGSISVEWCLRHPANRSLAIEARPERGARIARNRVELGGIGVAIVEGDAPGVLRGLEPPNAVFIGGGITTPGLFEACWDALPVGGRLVANVVSLEGETRLAELFRLHGGDMRRIAVSRLDPVGRLHGWRPAMPVTQWSATKP